MAILYEPEFHGERCFHCGKRLLQEEGPAVFWNGHKRAISLHLNCATFMVNNLARDVANAERIRDERRKKATSDTVTRPL